MHATLKLEYVLISCVSLFSASFHSPEDTVGAKENQKEMRTKENNKKERKQTIKVMEIERGKRDRNRHKSIERSRAKMKIK